MEEARTFEAAWPALEKELRGALTRRHVPADEREDILQETALRLLKSWDHIRPDSLWAFALTISLNIVRDEARKKTRRERINVDSSPVDRDPEHEALVRIELDRVRSALSSMTERQRMILLSEVGEATVADESSPAMKMARMRARRRLRTLVEGVSGAVVLPLGRMRRWLEDTHLGVANTAASLAGQVAVVVALSAGVLPTLIAPSPAPPVTADGYGHKTAPSKGAVTGGSGAGTSLSIDLGGSSSLRPAFSGSLGRTRERMNENFGVVRKDGNSFTIGDSARVGPYGVHETVSQTIGDSEVLAEARARYEAADCTNAFLARRHSACADPGSARAKVRAAVDDKRHEVDVETGPIN